MRHTTGALSVLLPSLPPESAAFEVPESMTPDDRQFLIQELGKISASHAEIRVRLDGADARLKKLETKADQSGQHDIEVLQKALEKAHAKGDVWKSRVWSILAVLITSALVGLVTHWLSTR